MNGSFWRFGSRRSCRAPVRLASAALIVFMVTAVGTRAGQVAGAAAPACKKGQVRVVILGKAQCRKLGTATASADQRLPLLRGIIGQNLTGLRTRRGRVLQPFGSVAGGGAGRVQTRLNRSLPKILKWADSHARVQGALAGAAAPCALDGLSDTARIDSFTISLNRAGDLSVLAGLPGGIRIEVFVGSGVACSRAEIPDCPTAAGALDGTDAHQNRVSLRVSQNARCCSRSRRPHARRRR
jgi:hypothetical protein